VGASKRALIEEGATISAASIWEIAIKAGLGKLDAPDDLPERVALLGFGLMPVTDQHAWQVRSLPFHHWDPFDRLLIAQAQVEDYSILTADAVFKQYDVSVIWET
jgi:PIN domain nuclease of toxin-antitoxin system